MKHILLLTTALGLGAASAFGQGAITFANNASTLVTTNNGVTSGSASSSVSARVELLYQPGSATAPSAYLVNGVINTSAGWETMLGAPIVSVGAPLAGRFTASATETTGSDVAANGNVWLTVIGWTGGYTSLDAAIAGGALIGESTIWEQASGTPPPGAAAAILGTGEFTGLTLTPTPEPSTMVLGGLGAIGALLAYRRRKA